MGTQLSEMAAIHKNIHISSDQMELISYSPSPCDPTPSMQVALSPPELAFVRYFGRLVKRLPWRTLEGLFDAEPDLDLNLIASWVASQTGSLQPIRRRR